MLHIQTVVPDTLELLSNIARLKYFQGLRLVGGTALSLLIGHRKSIDLDLFGKKVISDFEIRKALNNYTLKLVSNSPNIYTYFINDIKVDFVNYPYEWIEKEFVINDIIFAGKKDIAAMKINAITGRGKKKDFYDLYYLLKEFSFGDMFSFYDLKYPDGNRFLAYRSMIYFEDADQEEDPFLFDNINWDEVKKEIINKYKKFMSIE